MSRTQLRLSKRKYEVLNLIAMGNTVEQSGSVLGISRRTAYLYIYQLKEALGAVSLPNLILRAIEEGLLKVEISGQA